MTNRSMKKGWDDEEKNEREREYLRFYCMFRKIDYNYNNILFEHYILERVKLRMERMNDIWERQKEMEEKKIDNNIILVFINRIKHNLIINVHIQFKIQNIYNKKN